MKYNIAKNGLITTGTSYEDDHTVLLIKSDTFDGNTLFLDSSYYSHTFTTSDPTLVHSTDQQMFGASSIFFDGASSLSVAGTSYLDFRYDDFTIDWWEYRTVSDASDGSFSRTSNQYPAFMIYSFGGNIYFYSSSGGASWNIASQKVLNDSAYVNQWAHYAIVRNGESFYTFANGVLKDSWTSSLSLFPAGDSDLILGSYYTGYYLQGYLDEIRFTKGLARWTSTFSPPNEEYFAKTHTGIWLDGGETTDLLNNTLSYSIYDDDVFSLVCDLGSRVKIDNVRYMFDSITSSGTVANSIEFFASHETEQDYYSLPTNIGPGYYYTTVVSGESSARYVKIVHTVSGTSISGTITGFYIANDDEYVDFGETGTQEYQNIMASLDSSYSVQEIKIYNDGPARADAYVYLDPNYTAVDEILSISDSSNGPWYGAHTNNIFHIDTNSDWDKGTYNTNSVEANLGKLRLVENIGLGRYTTPIFYVDDMSKLLLRLYDESYRDLIKVEVKYSPIKPINLQVRARQVEYSDLIYSQEEYWDGGDEYRRVYFWNHGSHNNLYRAMCLYNEEFKTMFLLHNSGQTYNGQYSISISSSIDSLDGASYSASIAYRTSVGYYNLVPIFMSTDGLNGVWVYISCDGSGSGFPDYPVGTDEDGYHLMYFTNMLENTFTSYQISDFVNVMDVVYSTGDLWYTSTSAQSIYKISNSGAILVQYSTSLTNLGGVISLPDGGCWFASGKDLFRLDNYGELQDTIEDFADSNIDYLIFDKKREYVWIIDGEYIKRMDLTGRLMFSCYTSNKMPMKLYPADTGVWYWSEFNYYFRFISTDLQSEIEAYAYVEPSNEEYRQLAFRDVSYDTDGMTNQFPTERDSTWSSLEWTEINHRDYLFSENNYYQMRITLQETNNVRPEIESISVQKSLKISNINVLDSASIYLKTEIPDPSDNSYIGSYTPYIRVRWGIPI